MDLKSHESWIWMPHSGHYCLSHMCRFHLNTYVTGYIVSTVGELWPDSDVRRIFVKHRGTNPRLYFNIEGKISKEIKLTEEQAEKLLELKGDAFDDAYMKIFGYEEIGLNRRYETMVFKAKESEHPCCPFMMESGELDMERYNDPKEALEGHYAMCWIWHGETDSKLEKS